MKKRVKLLTTIASLCLAVALMAFGVYAATNISFSTTSNVSFATSAIEGEWYLTVKQGEAVVLARTKMAWATASDVTQQTASGVEIPEIAFESVTTAQTVTYTVEFVNTSAGENGIAAKATIKFGFDNAYSEVSANNGEYGLAIDTATTDTEVAAEATLTRTITLTYTCSDLTQASNATVYISASAQK